MALLNLRLGVFSLLVHDVQDHAARRRASLRGGVDADRLLSSACVLLAVHVNPAEREQDQKNFINPLNHGVLRQCTSPRCAM